MIEINTDNLIKARTPGAKDKKKRKKVTIQGKSLDQRRKEMKERMKVDKTAQYIWDARMGEEEEKENDGGKKRE